MLDLLIKGGTVIDGTGNPRIVTDVGVSGDRIVAVENLSEANASKTIDASGLIVAPGFIDIHSHADYTLLASPTADSKIHQGVTLEVVGNCGVSAAPISDERRTEAIANAVLGGAGLDWEWDTVESFLGRLRQTGTSVNVAALVGHGAIRTLVMGSTDTQPTGAQLEKMEGEMDRAMQSGAFGLSTGLIYPPNVYAGTNEIVALAKRAALAGGIYTSHIRGEGDTLLEAIDEAIEVGLRAGLPVEISHLKAQGMHNWHKMPKAIERIETARAAGLDVTADMYPYTASNTTLTALLPAWAHAGGRHAMLERLQDGRARQKIREALSLSAYPDLPSYWDRIFISSCDKRPDTEGRNLRELAAERNVAPEDVVMDLLVEVAGDASMIEFMMSDENVELGLRYPHVMIGSDGEGRAAEGILSQGKPHPRNYGTFARVLGHYSRDKKLFPLEIAVQKMTGLPATKLRLRERGLLKSGYFADITIFNADEVADRSTFTDPHQYAGGIHAVIVNGETVIWKGKHNGARPGRVITH